MAIKFISATDFDDYCCSVDLSLNEVLHRIDITPELFQIVTDSKGRLLGTLTDGDLRRALLRGAQLSNSVETAMNKNPKTGKVGEEAKNHLIMQNIGSTRAFLPLLDVQGIVKGLLIDTDEIGIESALIMAGGLGSRLGVRTRHTPKPLIKVGGRPILDHILVSLEKVKIPRIIISVNYLSKKIEDFIQSRDNKSEILILKENQRLGTAGSLTLINDIVQKEPILIMNGDVITSIDFDALYAYHNKHAFDGTIAVKRHDIEIPFGVVRQSEDGNFEGIDEKPLINNFIAAGIYYLAAEYRALVPQNTNLDMPELLNLGRKAGLNAGLFPLHEAWTDVGSPEDLREANEKAQEKNLKRFKKG